MKKNVYLGIDIGGTWIKGVIVEWNQQLPFYTLPELIKTLPVFKVQSRLSEAATLHEFLEAIDELISKIVKVEDEVKGIGISTAGIVDYHGKQLITAAKHLHVLFDQRWIDYLQTRFNTIVTIINDAEATSIGAASLGYLSENNNIGIMPIGTGLGFSVSRNSRRWTPNFSLPLLGCIYTPEGYYDTVASATELSKLDEEGNLCHIFTKDAHLLHREKYIKNLAGIISTAHIIYGVHKILIGGGLAEAVVSINFPLDKLIMDELKREALLTSAQVEVQLMAEGNLLPLIGSTLLAIGEEKAQTSRLQKDFAAMNTEKPYNEKLRLDELSSMAFLNMLWQAEQEAGSQLYLSLPSIASAVEKITERLVNGGRLIYVGAGTSGRLAAIDTVEIACTFGFPRDKVLTFIAGGIADAAIDIETRFEEDASSVPDLLYANITEKDVVVGISASGSAYYVQSALGFAKSIGTYTIMIQEEATLALPFCDEIIAFRSGNEVLAGSTRLKAGTATKKVLNFLSTATMVRLGKVHGCYMTDLACINEKLIKRAENILKILFDIDQQEANQLLQNHHFSLNQAIKSIQTKREFEYGK